VENGLDDMFNDLRWKRINDVTIRERGFYPNRIYFNSSCQQAAVVSQRFVNGDYFPLVTSAFFYLVQALEYGRIGEAYVVLKERGLWRVVGYEEVEKVRDNLREIEPYSGKYSSYWVIDGAFQRPKLEMPF